MNVVRVPVDQVHDWSSFHDVFAAALGFPDFYGRNLNAWVDCLSYADEDDGMRSITVPTGGVLTLQLDGGRDLARRCPDIFTALIDSIAFVNQRRMDDGDPPVLALAYAT